MEIKREGNRLIITGNIKSIEDYEKIKNELETIKQNNNFIHLDIKDSISITSSLIGYLYKLIEKDKINLSMEVGNNTLYEILEDLDLIKKFNVRKKS